MKEMHSIEKAIGLKTLRPTWAKAEIFIGLACVWAGLYEPFLLALMPRDSAIFASFGCVVFGGYLAMAGSRSHLYQSSNILAEFLWREIEKKRGE